VSAGNWFCLLVFPDSSPYHHFPHPLMLQLLPTLSLLLLKLLGGWGVLAKAGHPCLDTLHWGIRGIFPTQDLSKTQN